MWGFVASGALIGLGVFLLVAWWLRWDLVTDDDVQAVRRRMVRLSRIPRRTWTLLAAGVLGGLVVWAVWKWPVAVVAVPAAVVGLPALLSNRDQVDRIARLEAMEEWTRSLANVLAVNVGLEEALVTSRKSAPTAIAEPVARLVTRLSTRWDTETALRAFADDLDDQVGDRIATYLIQATKSRGTGLSSVLDKLAETVADEVRGRRQIEADRAKPRATARWVTIISATVLGVLALTGNYIEPYQSPLGQVVLVTLVGAYIAALVWLKRIATGKPPTRSMGAKVRREAARIGATTTASVGAAGSGRVA